MPDYVFIMVASDITQNRADNIKSRLEDRFGEDADITAISSARTTVRVRIVTVDKTTYAITRDTVDAESVEAASEAATDENTMVVDATEVQA